MKITGAYTIYFLLMALALMMGLQSCATQKATNKPHGVYWSGVGTLAGCYIIVRVIKFK